MYKQNAEPLCFTFEMARERAEQAAKGQLITYAAKEPATFLSSFYISAHGCWFFFANDDIKTPPDDSGKLVFTAYAVSQSGRCNLVYDFRQNMEKMSEYVSLWSHHALGNDAEAKREIEEFLKKYPVGA